MESESLDKRTTFGFVLIMLVLMVWMWVQAPPPATQPVPRADSLQQAEIASQESLRTVAKQEPPPTVAPSPGEAYGKYFAPHTTGTEKVVIVKTDLYTAEVTTKGGLIKKWDLRQYLTWDKQPVQLVDFDHGGDFSLLFMSTDGKKVDTRNLYFEFGISPRTTVELKKDESYAVDLVLSISPEKKIIKRYVFTNGKYDIRTDVTLVNLQDVVANYEYQVTWDHGLRYAEHNSVDESSFAMGYAYSGGELIEIDATNTGQAEPRDIAGTTTWVATRTKYFGLAIIPEEGKSQGAYLGGEHTPQPDQGVKETYSLALKMPYRGASQETSSFLLYLGPLDYSTIKSYDRNLDEILSLGAAWIIRPIAEYILIPLFQVLHLFIPNYGIVIIVFSMIIKLALHPLTRTSMRSMKKMQALQPMMNELREKYKDDPQKMNQAVMNLYKEYGVNPAAGCLPMLLQMPILFALWSVLRSEIGLRQANFVGWIQDLSIPDSVVTLPFTIPFFGITDVSGLALAMGATTYLQQKTGGMTDPRQKAMLWMMPIMLTLVFNNLPSGLNLYYFVFNLLSIAQQIWINKHHGDQPLRKVEPKKRTGGIMAKLTKDMPKVGR